MLATTKALSAITMLFFCAAGVSAEVFDVHGATQAYLATVPSEDIANTNGYVDTGYLIAVAETIASMLLAWLLLSRGWSRRWRDIAEKRFRSPFAQAFIYIPIYTVVTSAILFPLSWYSDFVTEHKYGLATQSFSAWFVESLIGLAVAVVFLSLFAAILYLLIRKTQTNWWAWGTGLAIVSLLFMLLISPVFISPLFNDYRPMDEGPLKEQILSIARANGMQAEDIKQVDESRQTNRVSANVSGLLGTARIALNDNLLNRADAESVEAVMAHEIGHYVLNHAPKMILAFFPILLGLFYLTHRFFDVIVKRKGDSWGIRDVSDYAGFPLLVAIFTVLQFLATPLMYRVVYMHEYEADLFAINATQNPEAWADVALLTAEYRKLSPPSWEENWLNHHPSPYMRIYTAMRWKAEHLPNDALDGGDD